VETGTCTRDQVTTTRSVAALGHDYGDWTVIPITSIDEVTETRICAHNSSHIETRTGTFADYLSELPDNTPDTPYTIAMNVDDLTGTDNTPSDVAAVITAAQKYVSLDLSASTLTSIGQMAFFYCSNLISITIPEGVTSIGRRAFLYCSSLTSVTIPDSVTSIVYGAFWGCDSLSSITIPKGVTDIGPYAFLYCSSLTTIDVASDNTTFSSSNGIVYNKDGSTLIICPAGKTGTVTIPNNVIWIHDSAFFWCTNLDSVIIPNSVTSIGSVAFYTCTNLISITIPASVTSIGISAFQDCNSLISVTFEGTIAEDDIGEDAFQGSDLREKYLAGGIGTYTTSNPGNNSTWTKQQ
jgi:hypothetical protein